jgi:SAM-dependent methyltransferase
MRPSSTVVGIDRDFFRLFLAHKYIAPAADFVCTPVAYTLPFAESCIGSVLCSDAFHYFPTKRATVNEMRRLLIKKGVIILTRVGNAAIKPTEGYELSVDGYNRLFSWIPHVMIGEDHLIDRYLEKKGPNLGETDDLKGQKWLSIVATDRKDLFKNHNMFDDWPHAVGRLVINPIYVPDESSFCEEQKFRFRFPSDWYACEDARYQEYAPSEWLVPRDVLTAIRKRERIPSMEEHIQRLVVIGVPERYW